MNRVVRTLAACVIGGVLAIGGAAAAHAEEPFDVGSTSVVDQTGKAGPLAPVTAAVEQLKQRAGIDLVVVYVGTFKDAQPADDCASDGEDCEWADETLAASKITDQKTILLAIAIDDRQQLISVSSQSGLSDDQLDAAESDDLIPALEQSDWTGAAVAYARALGDLATGTDTGSAAATKGVGFDWSGAAPWLAPIGVLALAAILWIVISIRLRYLRRRRA